MNSVEYLEMNACEKLLDKINVGSVNTPWEENKDQNVEIVKQFLTHHCQELKEKQ